MKNTPTKPKDLGRARRELDNDAVRRAYEVLQNWGNPFDDSRSSLINICSGIEASPEIKSDLLTAEAVSESCFESFWTDRIQSSNVPFYDPIKKLKLKSFTNLRVKKIINLKSKTLTIAAERSMFARLLIVARSRESLSLKEILIYSLSPIPWSLGLPDGGLVKTPKSKLLGKHNNYVLHTIRLIINFILDNKLTNKYFIGCYKYLL